jgi:hypothetical protein
MGEANIKFSLMRAKIGYALQVLGTLLAFPGAYIVHLGVLISGDASYEDEPLSAVPDPEAAA